MAKLDSKDGDVLDLPLDAAVNSGDFVAEGEAIVGFAVTDGDITADGYTLRRGGVHYGAPKETGAAWVLGDALSHDGTNFVKSSTLDVVAIAAAAAGSSDVVGDVALLAAPMANPARLAAVEVSAHTVAIPLTANAAKTFLFAAPFGGSIGSLKVACTTTLASSAGTITLAAVNGATSLLATADTDIEGTVGGAAPATVPLTATTANLIVAAGDVIKLTVTSDNADATGGEDLVAIMTMAAV